MKFRHVELGQLIKPAKLFRAGNCTYPILSMTMHDGLVDQAIKFKKRIASSDTSPYKVVKRNQLVVGFPIDEGVLSFQNLYDEAIVSPAYDIWEINNVEHLESRYLERFLRSPQALAFYASKLRGTTARRRTLPDDIFLTLKVPLPSTKDKQRRIADIIDKADAIRLKRQKSTELINNLISSIYWDTFGDTSKYQLSCLSDVCEFITKGSTPITSQLRENHEEGEIPFLKVLNINNNGKIDFDSKPSFINAEIHNGPFKRSKVYPGDVLMNIVGPPLGKIGFVSQQFPEWNVNQALAIFRAKEKVVVPLYLFHTLRHREILDRIIELAAGIRQLNLSLEQCRSFKIPVPPLSIQNEFVVKIEKISKIEEFSTILSNHSDNFFKSCVQRAFQGEL